MDNEISTDNSQIEVTTTDNSSDDLATQIANVLDKPENETPKTEVTEEQKETSKSTEKDNSQTIDCPDKFKNEDGSINVENLAKSYKELEKLNSQKTLWEKERAELLKYKESVDKQNQQEEEKAKNAGYDSFADMQLSYELAGMEANEFAKYLNLTEEPEVVRRMLENYMANPNEDAMEEIEAEFPSDVVKRVAIMGERKRQQYREQQKQLEETQRLSGIEEIVSKSVDNYGDFFNNEDFQNMFVSGLQNGNIRTYEDAEMLFKAVLSMKDGFQNELKSKQEQDSQNKEATDKLASISGKTSAQNASPNYENMSDEQLAREIRKYI